MCSLNQVIDDIGFHNATEFLIDGLTIACMKNDSGHYIKCRTWRSYKVKIS